MKPNKALTLIRKNTFRCLGCTDPVAIALATATALHTIGGKPSKVLVEMDDNIYKDTFAVGIPGGFGSGLTMAVAAGLVAKGCSKGLLLLEGITEQDVLKAEKYVESGIISCKLAPNIKELYVKTEVYTERGTGTVVIRGRHDNVILIKRNDEIIMNSDWTVEAKNGDLDAISEIGGTEELIKLVETISLADLVFLDEGIQINLKAAYMGIEKRPGLGVGQKLWQLYNISETQQQNFSQIIATVKSLTAAATDARMGGMSVPIIGCFGSGNHGITLFISLGILSQYQHFEEQKLLRALALSILLVGMVKRRTGILTPHCGCALAAGTGVAGGAAYLMGGTPKQVEAASLLVIANIFGMICDGAKPSCALKVSTAAGVALESAYIAVNGGPISIVGGITGQSLKRALENIEELTVRGFSLMDNSVISVLNHKND